MSKHHCRDPLDDFFRGFFVRPVEYGGGPVTPRRPGCAST